VTAATASDHRRGGLTGPRSLLSAAGAGPGRLGGGDGQAQARHRGVGRELRRYAGGCGLGAREAQDLVDAMTTPCTLTESLRPGVDRWMHIGLPSMVDAM
jgi:hypothetical protein